MTAKPKKPRKVVVWAVVDLDTMHPIDSGTTRKEAERNAADWMAEDVRDKWRSSFRIVRCEGVLK
jgi:hypothetical protein